MKQLRFLAALAPVEVMKDWMTPGAMTKWNSLYGMFFLKDGKSPVMSDFFSFALQLSGPQSTESGIFGFYNPYQDTILLVQTDNSDRVPKAEDFVFLSGTAFRGETLATGEQPQAIVPSKENLDTTLMKNIAAVTEIFQRDFPKTAKNFSLAKYRGLDEIKTLEGVVGNASLRVFLLNKFGEDQAAADALKAGEIALQLWNSDATAMAKYFAASDEAKSMLTAFASLSGEVRESLEISLYLKNKSETLFGFASPKLPALVVLVQVANEKAAKPNFVLLPLDGGFPAEVLAAWKQIK